MKITSFLLVGVMLACICSPCCLLPSVGLSAAKGLSIWVVKGLLGSVWSINTGKGPPGSVGSTNTGKELPGSIGSINTSKEPLGLVGSINTGKEPPG